MTNTTRSLVCTILLAGFALASAHAQSVYEPFAYTVGGNLAGNTLGAAAWKSINSNAEPTIASGNLSVAGLAAASGNSVTLPGGNHKEALFPFTTTPVSSGTLFYSFALNVSTAPTAASYMFGLATGDTNYGATVWLQASGAGYQLGISNRSNATTTYAPTVYALGQTVFIVGSYTFNAGAGDDSSSLWINPSAATFGDDAIPSATVTVTGGTDMTALSQFLIRGANGSPTGVFDELRVGTTWSEVTTAAAIPEPSTYAALLGALALAGVVLRRRSRLA